MRANKLFPILTFLAGIVAGGLLLGMMSFMLPPPPQPVEINPADARTFLKSYLDTTPVFNKKLSAWSIDMEVYNAMNQIYLNDHSITGFRIYKGLSGTENIAIVAGTRDGEDIRSAKYYQ